MKFVPQDLNFSIKGFDKPSKNLFFINLNKWIENCNKFNKLIFRNVFT